LHLYNKFIEFYNHLKGYL